jgi:hypothetical protein
MEETMAGIYNENAPAFSSGTAKSNLTAFFDSRADAESAIERLKEAGVTDARLMPGYEADDDRSNVGSDDRGGFFSALTDWFLPDEDRDVYAEGLRRGGFLVSASVDDATYDTAHDILDDHGAIDMDERADLWKADGWTARQANVSSPDSGNQPRSLGDAKREQRADASQDDASAVEPATNPGAGFYTRSSRATSPRIRSYDLGSELPDDLQDDVLPTGHQRDVSDTDTSTDREMSQSQEMDGLKQDQSFPRGR